VEESPGVLANRSSDAPSVPTASKEAGKDAEPEGIVSIVRATARLWIDPKLAGGEWKELQSQLYATQRLVARAQNACIRALWRDDGARLDVYLIEKQAPPKKKVDWEEPDINLYKIARDVAPDLPGAMASVCSRTAWQKWRSTRYDALVRQSCSPPHYRDTVPIPLRAADAIVAEIPGGFTVNFALRGGRGQRWTIRVSPRDEYQGRVLKNIAGGAWPHGNILIDRDRRGRWFLRIAYKRQIEKAVVGQVAAVNRGIRSFIVCVTEDGNRWIYDGNDIVAYLKQMQKRRQQYQRDSKASGRSGRGRVRILRPIEHLSGKGERWRETKCQTIARRLVEWLVARNVSSLCIENFQGIRSSDVENEYVLQLIQEWPYYQLEQRIRSCCAERGIEVRTLAPQYISQRCPKCGNTDEKNRDFRHWMMRCGSCGYKEHLDASAARILLQEREERAQ
jgi:IS605 OrfB family transposase